MRHLMLSIILCSGIQVNAQDSTVMHLNTGVEDKQLADILKFQGIEEYDLEIISHKLKGQPVLLSYEEYKDGQLVDAKDITAVTKSTSAKSYNASSDTVRLKVLSQEKNNTAKVSFSFSHHSFSELFKTGNHDDNYSMRYVLPGDRKNIKQVGNKEKQAMFVYTLPFENDHNDYYCTLTSTDVPVTKWWDKYHVKHYIVFYVQVG